MCLQHELQLHDGLGEGSKAVGFINNEHHAIFRAIMLTSLMKIKKSLSTVRMKDIHFQVLAQ